MAHESDPEADLDIYLGENSADIWTLYAMDEIYTTSQDPADHWENDVIESTRELLTGHYEIEITSWRGHQVKMTLTNRAGDARQMVSYDALWWLLLGPLLHRSYTTVSREVDYGVA